jgi:hypothetical protein
LAIGLDEIFRNLLNPEHHGIVDAPFQLHHVAGLLGQFQSTLLNSVGLIVVLIVKLARNFYHHGVISALFIVVENALHHLIICE